MLLEAIIKGDLESVRSLLGSEDKTKKQTDGSCICLAASKGHRKIVELLLVHGFDVNTEDAQGHSPVYYTVSQNELETTELLLRHGAQTNGKYEPLFTAARRGFANIVKVLLDFGADVNAKDDCGQTPLHHAILQDSAVFTFFRETADINMCAMENVVQVLLSNGTDVNAKTMNGFSPLHFAIKLKYPGIVSILLRHGANFQSLVDCEIRSPKISQFGQKSNRSVAFGKSSSSSLKPRLTTVLHVAAESNDVANLNLLLGAGADVDSVQYDNATPLILAIKRRHDAIVKVLLDFGADIEQKNKYGLTPLHLACRKGSIEIFNILLESGANVNAICNKGKVPYQYVLQLELDMKGVSLFDDHDMFEEAQHYYNRLYENSLTMKKTLQKHFIMMYITGFYLQDYNKEIALKTPNIFHYFSKKEITDFSKNITIFNNVTLFHVINKIRNPFYARNPNVLTGLNQAIFATNAKFPEFGNVINFLVRNARVRVNLIDTGIGMFIKLNRMNNKIPTLPFDVLEMVFSFLLNEEIQTFINCCVVLL